jgi:hypothetical protein
MCPCWDGGAAQRDENESEQEAWSDPLAGEMPGRPPRCVNDPDEWKDHDWHEGPEYRAWKKKRDEDRS